MMDLQKILTYGSAWEIDAAVVGTGAIVGG